MYVRYIDSYVDDEVQFGQGPQFYRPIGSFTSVDAQYTLTLGRESSPTLSFGGVNLLDEDPPHVRTNGGYDSKVADPRGRALYAKATFKF